MIVIVSCVEQKSTSLFGTTDGAIADKVRFAAVAETAVVILVCVPAAAEVCNSFLPFMLHWLSHQSLNGSQMKNVLLCGSVTLLFVLISCRLNILSRVYLIFCLSHLTRYFILNKRWLRQLTAEAKLIKCLLVVRVLCNTTAIKIVTVLKNSFYVKFIVKMSFWSLASTLYCNESILALSSDNVAV